MTQETTGDAFKIAAMEYLDELASVVNAEIVSVPVATLRVLRDFMAEAQLEIRFLTEFIVESERELRATRAYARAQGVRFPTPEQGGSFSVQQHVDGADGMGHT